MADDVKCKRCNDTGYYTTIQEGYEVMGECDCLAELQSVKNLENSGLDKFANKTINNFAVRHSHQQAMKDFAIEYVTSDSRAWFALLGAVGSGKSHLCAAVTKALIKKGIKAKYIVWDDFVTELNAKMFSDDDKRALWAYQTVPLLFIDDLFKGRVTEYNKKVAFDLINYRVNNELTTIISSEMSVSDLAEIDEAIASRIVASADNGYYIMEIPSGMKTNFRLVNSQIRVAK